MSESPIVRDAAGAGLTAFLAAIATGMGFPVAAFAAGLSASAQVLSLLAYDSVTRRGETFVSTFRRVLHEGHEGDFDAEVRERAKDPQFRNVTYQALRHVRDALDDAVVPALAVLTRDYTIPTVKRADAFLRGTSDLLRDLSAEEYDALVRTIALLADHAARDEGHIGVAVSADAKPQIAMTLGGSQRTATTNAPESCGAILDLILKNGLGRVPPEVSGGSFVSAYERRVAWGHYVEIEIAKLRRLQSILQRASTDVPEFASSPNA